ncbi:MAG: transglutaminase domain-containing protein [Mobilitalea sp.]
MLKKKEELNNIYNAVLSMALVFAFILAINGYYSLKISMFLCGIFSIGSTAFIYLFYLYRRNIITYLILAAVIVLLVVIMIRLSINLWEQVQNFMVWVSEYNGSAEQYSEKYAYSLLLGVSLLAAIVFYLIIRRQTLKYILAIVITVTLIILSVSHVNLNKATVSICIFYVMTNLAEICETIYCRKINIEKKIGGILYLVPICLMLAIFTALLPSRPEPIKWSAVKLMYQNIKEQYEVIKTNIEYYFKDGKSEFYVSYTGYTEDGGELNQDGEVIKDNKVALKLAGLSEDKTVYLTGSVSDIYEGNRWEKSKLDFIEQDLEYRLDYKELYAAIARLGPSAQKNNALIKKRDIQIKYNNLKTKTFFYPLKMSEYTFYTSYKKLSLDMPQISFKKARGNGTSYQVQFYEINLKDDAFSKVLMEQDSFTYSAYTGPLPSEETKSWINMKSLNNYGIEDSRYWQETYQNLEDRAKMINSRYLGLPEELPERVYQLAQDITKEYSTKYEKLKAIEQYLISNYTYTLKVKPLPEGKDFADYFLFETKQGYCTYYATAMAVLGRCIGIPTRYVEGYLGVFDKKDGDMYLVTNSQAHAWAEAYFEGVGWIPFEATTPFYENRYSTWPVVSNTTGNGNTTGNYNSPNPGQNLYEEPVVDQDIILEKEDNTIKGAAFLFLLLIPLLFILIMIYYVILKYRYKALLANSNDSKKVHILFLRILHQLKREGFQLLPQETVFMLSKRVRDEFRYKGVTFDQVADVFMRCRYAQEEMKKEDVSKLQSFHRGLLEKERQEESRLNVWFNEFLFLMEKRKYD